MKKMLVLVAAVVMVAGFSNAQAAGPNRNCLPSLVDQGSFNVLLGTRTGNYSVFQLTQSFAHLAIVPLEHFNLFCLPSACCYTHSTESQHIIERSEIYLPLSESSRPHRSHYNRIFILSDIYDY